MGRWKVCRDCGKRFRARHNSVVRCEFCQEEKYTRTNRVYCNTLRGRIRRELTHQKGHSHFRESEIAIVYLLDLGLVPMRAFGSYAG